MKTLSRIIFPFFIYGSIPFAGLKNTLIQNDFQITEDVLFSVLVFLSLLLFGMSGHIYYLSEYFTREKYHNIAKLLDDIGYLCIFLMSICYIALIIILLNILVGVLPTPVYIAFIAILLLIIFN